MIWPNFGLNYKKLMVFRQMGAFVDRTGQKEYEKNSEFNQAVEISQMQPRRGVAELHLPKLSFSEKGSMFAISRDCIIILTLKDFLVISI